MVQKIAIIVTLAIGVLLTALGVTWRYWHSPQMIWGRQDAKEYTDAYMALKATAGEAGRRPDSSSTGKLAANRARFDEMKTKLDRARAVDGYAGMVLSIVGIVSVAISAWLLLPRHHSTA
jgi:predicted negative regulator of RcsB-dependent stress response